MVLYLTSSEWKDKAQMCRLVVHEMLFFIKWTIFQSTLKRKRDFVMATYWCQDLVLLTRSVPNFAAKNIKGNNASREKH